MVGRTVGESPGRGDRGPVSPGMEPRAPPFAAAVRRSTRRRLPLRLGSDDARARATTRGAHAALARGPHGATPPSHGGRRAHGVAGRSGGSALRRPAPEGTVYRARLYKRWGRPTSDAMAASSGCRLDRLRAQLLGLACARPLRSRARVRLLAPHRARLFPRQRPAVLAARAPRVAGPDRLAALDDGSVPGPRHVPEPAAGHDPDLLRPRDLRRMRVHR